MARKKSSKNSKAGGNQAVAADTPTNTTNTTLDTIQDRLKPAPVEDARIHRSENPWTPSQNGQQEEQEPETHILTVERAPPQRYEDDNDDGDHRHQTERVPLIRTYSSESGTYSDGGPRTRSNMREPGVPESDQPTTWGEWAMMNGLHPRTWSKQTYIKAGLLVTLLTLIILSFTVFRIQDHIKDILRYIDGHKRIGAVLFIASYTVACTLFLPGSLFTIGAGFLFKPFPIALLIVLLGDVFAAVVSFIFGRYVFYDWVKGMMSKHPKFNALDQVIQDDGWKIVVMLRLTPIPFNLITYFFSITSIRLWTVVWATCIGVLPGSCIGIWIGSLLKGLSGIDNPELATKNVVILVMNGIFVACCILTLSLFGKRSLRKAMKRLDQHQALTSLQEVEVVIEGVASVIRELEDNASIPPSLRSTMVEQLAAEEEDQDYFYRTDLETAHQRHLSADQAEGGEGSSATSSTLAVPHEPHHGVKNNHGNKAPAIDRPALASSGFTRGEKMTFVVIAVVAVLNVCVCVPLYYHFANQEE
ncbi:hypothetical protein BGZ97_006985 [Linnemannia gamsii]|uniref:VTT domain-containing protein n=1 Tax=Linnemannia gamsii TaxID=64522 RepID=A0A9P6UEC3_9FUNG|nr:hypothetical protein BGZ97_006985 [Linnemannia gamsii]